MKLSVKHWPTVSEAVGSIPSTTSNKGEKNHFYWFFFSSWRGVEEVSLYNLGQWPWAPALPVSASQLLGLKGLLLCPVLLILHLIWNTMDICQSLMHPRQVRYRARPSATRKALRQRNMLQLPWFLSPESIHGIIMGQLKQKESHLRSWGRCKAAESQEVWQYFQVHFKKKQLLSLHSSSDLEAKEPGKTPCPLHKVNSVSWVLAEQTVGRTSLSFALLKCSKCKNIDQHTLVISDMKSKLPTTRSKLIIEVNWVINPDKYWSKEDVLTCNNTFFFRGNSQKIHLKAAK